jgi:acyl carrier protein
MEEKMEGKVAIRDFILGEIERRGPLPFAKPEENLSYRFFDCGHVDSFGMLAFVARIEERFGVTLGAEELQSEQFRTVGGVVDIVLRLLEEKE